MSQFTKLYIALRQRAIYLLICTRLITLVFGRHMAAKKQEPRSFRYFVMNGTLFRLGGMSRRNQLAITVALIGATMQLPTASLAASNTEGPQSTQDMDEVVVSAQAVPGAVIGDVPPENQLNPTDIASYGVSTVSDLLNEISDQTQSEQGRDSSSGPIILVNGKRISGINEVGDFPTESILRVDILPEEVALKYGYGAQQKVVNIILRRFFRAKVANLDGGASTEGGGKNGTGDLSDTRIRDNDRINIVGRVKSQAALRESDRGVSSTAGTISDPSGTIGDDSDARTLSPATRTYSLNGVVAHTLSNAVTASFNATASYQTSRALNGDPASDLQVPASSPFALGNSDTTVDRYLSDETLHQDIDTAKAHAGVTLNADLPKMWRLSMIGNYDYADTHTQTDRGYDLTTLQAAIDAGEIDPYGPLPSSALGSLRGQDARAITNTGGASVLANGKLFRLPAGDVTTSMKLGGNFSGLDSTIAGQQGKTSNRTQATGQISMDVPLTSRSNHVLSAIGDLSVNVTDAVTDVSSYGSLGNFGYGLHWSPRKDISIIASVNEDRQAPTLAQLSNPIVTTSNVRVYDYVQGKTVTVSQVSGGNPDLQADDRHVFKLGATLAPISTTQLKLNFTANYIQSVTRNAVGTLSSATANAERAFPDRFERDEDGALETVDSRAVNFDREERKAIRWGFNLTKQLRAPTRPTRPPGSRPPGMRNRQPSAGGARAERENAPRGTSGGPEVETTRTDGAPAENAGGQSPAESSGNRQDEVVVAGERESAGNALGPPPPDFLGQPDGPAGGAPSDGLPPGGRGQRPGGGFGPSGNRGGGRGGGFGGGGNGAQLELSLYHSWYFRDEVRFNAEGPTVDLLNGGTIGSGGQARHRIQFNAGVLDNGVGVRLSGSWTSPTDITDRGDGSGPLFFSSLATFDFRLFANLQQRFVGKEWARGTRVTLAVSNLFNAHQDVRDGSGATPQIYQPAFLDPYGRVVSLSFRRLF
ncbi:MAG: TonB-dependent receptor [Gammaproteobacteria bacterium]